jgi:polar amino acid transport system ATP-binding protein
VVICGPSGSGKSTLIRCINRLEKFLEGKLIGDGTPLHDYGTNLTKLRADIGFVFQQFHLYPHMTALQNVTLAPIHVRKINKKEAEKLGLFTALISAFAVRLFSGPLQIFAESRRVLS